MNKKNRFYLAILTAAVASTVQAAPDAGFYYGGQVGASNTHNVARDVETGGTPPVVNVTPKNTGLGARLYVGYSGNQYIGGELGWTYYAPSTYDTGVSPSCDNSSIRENAVDLVAKGTFPIQKFGLFGKAGVALANINMSGRLTNDTLDSCASTQSSTSVRPVIGIGASYDLTQNWIADLTWSRIVGGGDMKNADLIAIGISYHFVDAKCGQFLC